MLAGLGDDEDEEDGCFLTEEEIQSASAAAQAKAASGGSSVGRDPIRAGHSWERCACGAENEEAEQLAAEGEGEAGDEPAWCSACGTQLVLVLNRSPQRTGSGGGRRQSPTP